VTMDALTEIGGTPLGYPPVPLSSWSLRQTVCSTFSGSGWSFVRSASLAKGGTSKKGTLPHLHKVPTRSDKMSPRTFQTALILMKFITSVASILFSQYFLCVVMSWVCPLEKWWVTCDPQTGS
jgi:hypothetical protein